MASLSSWFDSFQLYAIWLVLPSSSFKILCGNLQFTPELAKIEILLPKCGRMHQRGRRKWPDLLFLLLIVYFQRCFLCGRQVLGCTPYHFSTLLFGGMKIYSNLCINFFYSNVQMKKVLGSYLWRTILNYKHTILEWIETSISLIRY